MSTSRNQAVRSGGRSGRRKQRAAAAGKSGMSKGTELGAAFQPLSQPDVRRVHSAALDLLERVGMGSSTGRVLDVALANGCSLDDAGRLLFPRSLVEDALALAAKQFVVHGRDAAFDFEARNGKIASLRTNAPIIKALEGPLQ